MKLVLAKTHCGGFKAHRGKVWELQGTLLASTPSPYRAPAIDDRRALLRRRADLLPSLLLRSHVPGSEQGHFFFLKEGEIFMDFPVPFEGVQGYVRLTTIHCDSLPRDASRWDPGFIEEVLRFLHFSCSTARR